MEHPKLGVHLSHCNFGEHAGTCKYGDKDCPALTNDWSWFGSNIEMKKKLVHELRDWLDRFAGNAIAHYMANALWQEISSIVAKYDIDQSDRGLDEMLDVVMSDRHRLKVELFELGQKDRAQQEEINSLRERINNPQDAHLCNGEVWRSYPSAVCSCCKTHTDSILHENLLSAVNRLQKLVFEKSK